MNFEPLSLAGAYRVAASPMADERGHFARLWCRESFAQAGLALNIEQASASFNHRAGTLRGMHFAWPPAQEAKLVRCARGRMVDVLLDLRPGSLSYRQWLALELAEGAHDTLVVPPGVAHGFQTLIDCTEVHYMMSEAYRPDLGDGVRFDDPSFGIRWPLPVSCIAERDRSWPLFDSAAHAARFAAAQTEARHAA